MLDQPQKITEAFGLEANKSRYPLGAEFAAWATQNYKFEQLFNDFWGLSTRARLVAISQDVDDNAWRGLVSEWDSFGQAPGQFRLNKSLVENLLQNALGETAAALRAPQFRLQTLSELELAVFENFFIELENHWRDYWRVHEANASGNYTYLIWAFDFADELVSYMAVAVPPGIGPSTKVEHKQSLDVYELAHQFAVRVPVDLSVGRTKLSVADLKHLENGDLLVFEMSSVDRLTWTKDSLFSLDIAVQLPGENERPQFYYDDVEIMDMVEESKRSNDLLTDLPVELVAQFKSVNMPLQKLMELEAGGVLPLGLLLDSKLVLMAPGDKPIAQGELVVVGNQFGMKVEKVNFKASHGDYPRSRLSSEPAVDMGRFSSAKAADARINQARAAAPQNTYADDLDQDLEDVGIDPKELDELEDLY